MSKARIARIVFTPPVASALAAAALTWACSGESQAASVAPVGSTSRAAPAAPGADAQQASRRTSFHGIEPSCPARPPGAAAFELRFVINNSPNPVPASNPAVPTEVCRPGSTLYGTADGEGTGTPWGKLTMHDRYCIRPPNLTGVADFTLENGDMLRTEYFATPTAFPPPFPDVEFTGSGTVTGGTGNLAGATGAFGLAGKQLGVPIPGTSLAAQSAFIFCGHVKGR